MKKEQKNKAKNRKIQKPQTEVLGLIREAISDSRSLTKDIIRERHSPPSTLSTQKKHLYWNL